MSGNDNDTKVYDDKNQQQVKHIKSATKENHILYYNGIKIDYLMDPADNFLPNKYRSFLMKCIHNIKIQIFIACVIVFNDIIVHDLTDKLKFYDDYIKWITDIIFVHTFIGLWILSVNRRAFKHITKTFEFWLKIYYAFISISAAIAYEELQVKESDHTLLRICQDIQYYGGELMTILFISLFDGIQTKDKYKAIISGIAGFYWISNSIYYQFFLQDEYIVHVTNSIQISFIAWQANAWRILGIFFFKQCVWNILGKTRATLISHRPNLIWKSVQQISQTTGISKKKSTTTNDENDVDNIVRIDMTSVKKLKSQQNPNRNSFSISTKDDKSWTSVVEQESEVH
eukprot:99134_1